MTSFIDIKHILWHSLLFTIQDFGRDNDGE
jgi:hypothetical protein